MNRLVGAARMQRLGFILLSILALNCSLHAQERKLVYPDKDHKVVIRVGGEAIVSLPRAGGTGYYWDTSNYSTQIVRTREVIEGKGDDRWDYKVGAPESDSFVLVGLKPGRTTIDFTLQRVKSSPAEIHSLVVDVKE